jgi:hypothetical protein
VEDRLKGEKTSGQDSLPIYLSVLEQAKFDLERAEKWSGATEDPLGKLRWSIEADVRRILVRMYDGLVKILQEREEELRFARRVNARAEAIVSPGGQVAGE